MPIASPSEIVRLQNAAVATGNGNTINVNGSATVGFQVSGTFSATVTFEATIDGTNWVSLQVLPSTGTVPVTTATAPGGFTGSCAGYTLARARVTWTSGTSVTVVASAVAESMTSITTGTAGVVDTELPAAAALADATANPTTTSVGSETLVFNGATWDRARTSSADALAATGLLASGSMIYNGATWDRARGDTSNGLDVDVTRLSALVAGSAHIGQVGGETVYVQSTPVMSVGSSYATGDYIGTTTTPQSFASAVRTSGGKAVIQSITISDKNTNAAVPLELWLFSATFVAPTDSAAWAISDAEALTVVGIIPITTDRWFASSNNKVYSDNNVGLVISCAATSLFYALVARGAPTLASGDLQISLGISQD